MYLVIVLSILFLGMFNEITSSKNNVCKETNEVLFQINLMETIYIINRGYQNCTKNIIQIIFTIDFLLITISCKCNKW